MFLRPQYVRRFPSFVSVRTFADMTTWPYMTMTTLKKSKADPIFCWACTLKSSAGPGPPAPAVANTTRHANGQRPLRRINHRRCYGSGDEQAIQWASRFQCRQIVDNGEAADISPSLHRKEMLECKYDDDDDDDGAVSQTYSEGPPELESSCSGDDIQDHQNRQDLSENPRGSPILPRVNCCSN